MKQVRGGVEANTIHFNHLIDACGRLGLGAVSGLLKLQTFTPPKLPIFNPSDRHDSPSTGCFHPERQIMNKKNRGVRAPRERLA